MKYWNNHKLNFYLFSVLIFFIYFLSPFSSIFANFPQTNFVATPDSNATKIAEEILSEGGNAVDAGIAAMFALTVVEPFSNGLGGGGLLVVHINNSRKTKTINFREAAPINVDPKNYYQSNEDFEFYSSIGWGSICVPGMVAGADKALKTFGTKTIDQILKPVIKLAENGFPVNESLNKLFIKYYDHLEADRNTSEIFFPDWMPKTEGEILKRDDLALTYKLMSTQGAQIFYEGEIAEKIDLEMKSNNGLIRLPDLYEYEATVNKSVKSTYKDCEINTVPLPSSAGVQILELLKILEKYDLKKLSLNSGPYIHLFVEACKLVFQDRSKFQFGVTRDSTKDYKFLISKENISQVSKKIDSLKVRSNDGIVVSHSEIRNASQISIIDKFGNAVSISLSLNHFFGSGIMLEKYGVLFNNAMNNFSREPNNSNSIKPKRRPQISLAPIILIRNQKPFLVIGGSSGERVISTLAQIIINVLEFNSSLKDAVDAPRFSYNYYNNTVEMESRIESNSIDYLKKLGHKTKLMNAYDVYFGNVQAVLYDSIRKKCYKMNDVRQEEVVYFD